MRLDLTTAYVAAGAVLLGATAGAILMYAKRRPPRSDRNKDEQNGAPAWTILTAAVATAVSADGMWQTFNGMEMPIALRLATFAFLELMVLQSAIRARQAMRRNTSPGIDGIAMWFWTLVSALLSASHEAAGDNPDHVIVAVRFIAPLAAAWGWERSMALERKLRTGESLRKIHWRISPERILVRLGLAEAADRTVVDVDAHRRITRLARAAKRLRTLEETGAWKWQVRRATARVDRATERAVAHANLSTDPERRQQLIDQISVLYNAAGLAALTPPAPWTATVEHRPSTTETAVRDLADVGALALDNRTRRALGLPPTTPTPRPIVAVDDEPAMARPTTTVRRLTVADAAPSTTTTDGDAHRRPTADDAPAMIPADADADADADDRRRPTTTARPSDAADTSPPADGTASADAPTTIGPAETSAASADDIPAAPTNTARRRPTTAAAQPRPAEEWANLTSHLYWDLRATLKRRPTAPEFAAAIAADGQGAVSVTTAKAIRTAIEARPAPPTTADAQTSLTDDGPRINGRVLTARP